MYRKVKIRKSKLKGIEKLEGETIETKMKRILETNEPIEDGAPELYTDKKDGVLAGYNIRTDRWEIAVEAKTTVLKNEAAKRDAMAKKEKEAKIIEMKPNENKSGEDKSKA